MWLTGITGGVVATWLVLAQTSSTPDPTTFFAQLGIASVVCGLLLVWGFTLQRSNNALTKQIADLNAARLADRDAQLARERELSTGVIPLLTQAADLLAKAPIQFDRALNEATRATGQSETNATVRRLEALVERLGDDHDR